MSWPRPPGGTQGDSPGDKATPSPGLCTHTRRFRFVANSFLFFPFPEVLPRARTALGAWQARPGHEVMLSARAGTALEQTRSAERRGGTTGTRGPAAGPPRGTGENGDKEQRQRQAALGALGRSPAVPAVPASRGWVTAVSPLGSPAWQGTRVTQRVTHPPQPRQPRNAGFSRALD